jgi:hypothetical protein
MKTTERFDKAVTKLYNAFHENRLNGMDCKACAVGNMCDNVDYWTNWSSYKKRKEISIKIGYSFVEIDNIESLFMFGVKINEIEESKWDVGNKEHKGKETQFKGLCAVVEYLCELDNIPNIMDYTKLFETENDKPKYQLIEL